MVNHDMSHDIVYMSSNSLTAQPRDELMQPNIHSFSDIRERLKEKLLEFTYLSADETERIDPVLCAVFDIAMGVKAKKYLGNGYSDFSLLVSEIRRLRGKKSLFF